MVKLNWENLCYNIPTVQFYWRKLSNIFVYCWKVLALFSYLNYNIITVLEVTPCSLVDSYQWLYVLMWYEDFKDGHLSIQNFRYYMASHSKIFVNNVGPQILKQNQVTAVKVLWTEFITKILTHAEWSSRY